MSVKGGAVIDPDSGVIQYLVILTNYSYKSLIVHWVTHCPFGQSLSIHSVKKSHLCFNYSRAGLEDVAHVLEVKGEVYNAVLGLVDITRGTNSYYKLQVLKKDNSEKFVFCHSNFG